MRRLFLIVSAFVSLQVMHAMCGCMVPMRPPSQTHMLADLKLYNESSKVILVRDGHRTVVTMSNDFKGPVKDFALVVPVPEVLTKKDIREVDPAIFASLNNATAPTYVQQFDLSPCRMQLREMNATESVQTTDSYSGQSQASVGETRYGGVKIESQFSVGSYDILVLSATQSEGLTNWLGDNNYMLPESSAEVIRPYVKSGMKFFVAKVNLDKVPDEYAQLKPLQMAFETNRFVLPIRFGMGNAKGDQDMVVYGLTKNGRMEATNYRTVNMPSNYNLPEFVTKDFDRFYSDAFEMKWKREGGNAIVLEYAGARNGMQNANPGIQIPRNLTDLTYKNAGVWWLDEFDDVFVTRMHIRYNREDWVQDIQFQSTPNNQFFRVSYPVQMVAREDLSCDQAQIYLAGVAQRREKELHNLARLTDWNIRKYDSYLDVWKEKGVENKLRKNEVPVAPTPPNRPNGPGGGWLIFILFAAAGLALHLYSKPIKALKTA